MKSLNFKKQDLFLAIYPRRVQIARMTPSFIIPRFIAPSVEEALGYQSAVALIGPRQVGKTTLALEIGQKRNALYLGTERYPISETLEAISIRAMSKNCYHFGKIGF